MPYTEIGNVGLRSILSSDGAGGGPHMHENAIHDDIANEIAPIEPKYVPITTDAILIEDSEDSNNKKSVALGWLFGLTSTVFTSATGGTRSTAGGYVYHDFIEDGEFIVEGAQAVDILLVGGGGGGGAAGYGIGPGGGGGGGEVKIVTGHELSEGSYEILVGEGGARGVGQTTPNQATSTGGANGGDSAALGYTAIGGGGGGTSASGANPGGSAGGSGGGGGYNSLGGSGTIVGHGDGGDGNTGSPFDAGGGGGANDDGDDGAAAGDPEGGTGLFVNAFSTFGGGTDFGDTITPGWFGGGGGGGKWGAGDTSFNHAGREFGGGGRGSVNTGGGNGFPNMGGGGGGARDQQFGLAYHGGSGGAGRVIIRYLEDPVAGSGLGSVGLGDGAPVGVSVYDPDAIHDNEAAEISAIANKVSPVGADYLVIEDSEDSDVKKHITLSQLSGLVTDTNAIHDNVSGEIAAVATKSSPVAGDLLLLEDSEASNTKKAVTVGNLLDAGVAAAGFTKELVMQDGVTNPPVPLETEAQDDWLYQD